MIKSIRQKISIMLIASMLACSCPVNAFADEIIQENLDSGMATISETASVSELDEYDDSSESDADYAAAFKPAFEMSSDPIDGAVITVSAEEGVLPEGARLAVKKISFDAEEMADIDAAIDNYNTVEEKENYSTKDNSYIFDIKIIDAEGNVIQPDGTVQVRFELAETGKDIVETQVYHLKNIKEADEAELNRLAEAARAVETDDDDDFEFPDGELINDLSSKTRYQSETTPDETEDEEASIIKETSFIAEELEVLNCEMDESGKSVELVTATDSFSLFKFVLLGANDIAEARIEGKTEYSTLADAVTAFEDSDEEITLLQDVVLSETLVVNKNIVLNLNGHTISGNGSFSLIQINQGYGLTVKGDSGKVMLNSANQYAFDNEGLLTLSEGVGVEASMGSCFGGEGRLHIDTLGSIGGSEYNGETVIESGQFTSSATFKKTTTITGGTFRGTTIFSDRTGISGNSVFSGAVTFNDTDATHTTTISGGSFNKTVTLSNKGIVDIEYGEFTDSTNSLVINSGKVLFKSGFVNIGSVSGGEVEVTGGTFESNFTATRGRATISQGDFKSVNTISISGDDVKVNVTGGEFSAQAINISDPNTVSITGGSFDKDVSLYIDNNHYVCERKSDGRWYVSEKTEYCARIGEVKYATLSQALAAVQEGETIVLLKNYVNQGPVPASPSVSFTIDMNNCVVPSGCDFTLYSKTVTVKNGTVHANIRATESGKIVLESGYFGGTISADNDGIVNIHGGYFTNDPSAFVTESGYTCDHLATQIAIGGAYYNYVVSKNSDHVAKIGSSTYRTLETALSAANPGDTIELIKSITVNDTIVIDKSISIALGNNSITSTATSTAVSIESENVRIMSTGGKIYCNSTTTGKYVGIDVIENCSLETTNVDVIFSSNAKYTTLDAIRNNGSLIFKNGDVNAPIPDGSYVYMIYSQLGATQLIDSTITAITNGNGEFIKATGVTANASGNVALTNTSISISNSHSDSGTVYGIELMGTGDFTMNSGSRLNVNCPNATGIKEIFGVFKPTLGGEIMLDNSKVVVNAPKIDGVRGISLWNDPVTLSNLSGVECHGNKNAIAYYSGGNKDSNISDSSLVIISDSNASACISASVGYVYTSGGYYFVGKANPESTTQPRYFIQNVRARGGYYNIQPDNGFMDEGYTVQHLQNPDHIEYEGRTYYYGIKMTKVAKIMGRPDGTVYFETLESALTSDDGVKTDETITIMQSIELENTVQVVNTANKFSIDLAGFDIYGNIPGRDTVPASILWISSGDVTLKGNGKIYNTNATVSETSAVKITGGLLTIEDGEYSVAGASEGTPSSVIYVGGDGTNQATVNIEDGKFTAAGDNGYAVFAGDKGTVNITGIKDTTGDNTVYYCGYFRTEKASGPVLAASDSGSMLLSAGYYSHEIRSENGITIAPGKACLENRDPDTRVKYPYYIDDEPDENVAEIVGGDRYPTLQAAVDAVSSDGDNIQTVRLLKDITTVYRLSGDESYTDLLVENKELYLDMNGYDIRVSSDSDVILITSGKLTLVGSGTIENLSSVDSSKAIYISQTGAKLTVNAKDISISGMTCILAGYYIARGNSGSPIVTINDGKYKGDFYTGKNGSTSYGTINISGGIFDRDLNLPECQATIVQYHECVENTDIEPTDIYPWKVVEYFEAKNTNTGISYHTLREAFENVNYAEKIRLLRDVGYGTGICAVPYGITLDLNGKGLTCTGFSSDTSDVIDRYSGVGYINNSGSILLKPENKHFPVKDPDKGYKFYIYQTRNNPLALRGATPNELQLKYVVDIFDKDGKLDHNSDAYLLMQNGYDTSGLTFYTDVTWKEKNYSFKYEQEDPIPAYAAAQYQVAGTKAIIPWYIIRGNRSGYQFNVLVTIQSSTGFKCQTGFDYTFPAEQ